MNSFKNSTKKSELKSMQITYGSELQIDQYLFLFFQMSAQRQAQLTQQPGSYSVKGSPNTLIQVRECIHITLSNTFIHWTKNKKTKK